jgi:hypothetical protein
MGAVVLIACPSPPDAIAAMQSKCLAGKTKCMSKNAVGSLKCEQKAETPGEPADPNAGDCMTKVMTKFDGGLEPAKGCFEKLEGKRVNDCITFDDTTTAEQRVDDCVADLVLAVDPLPRDQSKCNAGKKKCVAKTLKSILQCHQKAQTPGKPTDPDAGGCLTKARAKFDGGPDPAKGCVAKLENKSGNDCLPPTGNTVALETLVDTCTSRFLDLIAVTTTTSTSSTTSTTLVSGCFQDWGDGTIRDTCTGLQWEKKESTTGIHNVSDQYTWSGRCGTSNFGCQPTEGAAALCRAATPIIDTGMDGCRTCDLPYEGPCNVDSAATGAVTTAWEWLRQLNDANFASHNDWRLPSEDGRNTCPTCEPRELETILLGPYPCGTPCIDPIFGPMAADRCYWSSTTEVGHHGDAWVVCFLNNPSVGNPGKYSDYYVRAVRAGS